MSSHPSKFLIVNADDFGYSYSVNKGIIEAHENGIVTSTSILVESIAASEAAGLSIYPDLSLGLHLTLPNLDNVTSELSRQVSKFIAIVGKMPDHIDTHKRHTTDAGIRKALEEYSHRSDIPIRNFHAKHIQSFGVHTGDASVERLLRSIDEATDQYNELMVHCGYSDDYLREHSSYSDPREQELRSLCDPRVRDYINSKGLSLSSWNNRTI